MAIDSSIYGAIRAPKQVNPLEQYAQVQQIQSGQNQNKLAELMLGDKQRETADQAAIANAYRSATDPATGAVDRNKLYGALAQGGQGAKLPTVQKGFADQDKAAADTQKSKIEASIKELDAMGQLLSGVKDQVSWEAARAQAAQMFGPEKVNASMPQQYDAALVGQKRDQALSVKDQLEQKWKAMEYTTPKADARLSADTSRANNAATVGATIRGQNMTDARSREATSATLTKPFEITGEDGKPVLVQQDKQGNIKQVQGYTPKQGASKPLTDGQSKALLFGSRMQESGAILDQLAVDGRTTSIPGSRAPVVGAAITALGGEKNQKLEQAKRDFINATLRRESGAVIADSEFDNAEKQYFPQIGDSTAVIAQKKRNREVATRGILAEVPDSENRVAKVRAAPVTSTPAGPNIDALLHKYK